MKPICDHYYYAISLLLELQLINLYFVRHDKYICVHSCAQLWSAHLIECGCASEKIIVQVSFVMSS